MGRFARGAQALLIAVVVTAGAGCSSNSSSTPGCVRDCAGRFCGSDGCGGTCGTCGGVTPICSGGTCVADCTPNCAGKTCGSDGCGGSCGTCSGATPVCSSGTCIPACTPACSGKTCGDNGCGGTCGMCGGGTPICASGTCVASCTPNCTGKTCGDNGCGGNCGTCTAGQTCQAGTCASPTVIYGRVTSGVAGADGVTVQVDNLSTSTDANGDYRLENVVPGSKVVEASKSYYLPSNTTVALASGTTLRVDFSLTAVGELHGTVKDSLSGAPIAGAEVTVGSLTSYTAADGSYFVIGIYPGSYQLQFSASGYAPVVSWLDVPGGLLTTLDRQLDLVGTISGKVTAAVGGAAISGATVMGGGAVAISNGSGNFTLTEVSPGAVTVIATATGYDSKSSSVSLDPGGSATTNFALSVTSTAPSNITGHVTNAETLAPVSGAYVSIDGKSAYSAADGSYSLVGVTPGARTSAYSNATGFAYSSFYIDVPPGTWMVQDFALKPYHTVYVAVSDYASGAPVPGASVGAGGGSCTTNSAGWCALQAVSGPTTLSISATGYRSLSIEVEISTAATSLLTATISTVPRVCGVVRDAETSNPLSGADVTLLYFTLLLDSVISAGDGTFCLENSSWIGSYLETVGASKVGYTNNAVNVQMPATGTVNADVLLWPAGSAP